MPTHPTENPGYINEEGFLSKADSGEFNLLLLIVTPGFILFPHSCDVETVFT